MEPSSDYELLMQIIDDAPDVPGYGGGKWAIYSRNCCWWTSNPEEVGQVRRQGRFSGLPCCPTCRSVLMQAPLNKFIASAIEHHPPDVLPKFVLAHNAIPCHRTWEEY